MHMYTQCLIWWKISYVYIVKIIPFFTDSLFVIACVMCVVITIYIHTYKIYMRTIRG